LIPRHHFSFDEEMFEQIFAHGGDKPIYAWRATSAPNRASCNFIDLVIVPPQGDIGVHTHDLNNEEVYVVVSGCGVMLSEGIRFPVNPGDVVVNPPGGTHALWNTGDTDMWLVVIEIPVRRRAGEADQPRTPGEDGTSSG
jgi:mannose-6-phosphate isomerase-like protein (cupin superfamily)